MWCQGWGFLTLSQSRINQAYNTVVMRGTGVKGLSVCRAAAGLLLASICISGCSSGLMTIGNVKTSTDQFSGVSSDRMMTNPLSCANDTILSGAPTIGLLLQRSYGKDYKVMYHLVATWYGQGWGNIEAGESLILMVDGKRMGFYGEGSGAHRVVEGAYVSEESWYPSNFDQLNSIAQAREVTVTLKATNSDVSRCMTTTNLDNFKVFLKYFPPYIAIEGPVRK